jgi:glycosyltransferase involved in cell wall biosynthesis
MKILMMGWGFPPKIQGGLDTHVYEMSKELAKRNEVFLALPEFNCPGSTGRVKAIPIKCSEGSLIKTVKEYNRNIIKQCSGMDFDVIHSHDWFCVPASEGLRAASGKPWILTMHSLERMRSQSSGQSVIQRMESRGMQKSDGLVAVSRYMKREMESACGRRDIRVVYNAANVVMGHPENIMSRLGLGKNSVVLFMGRLSQQKGVEHLLAAAKKVSEKMPDARFVVAGDGHLKSSLTAFATHLGLDGKVILTGFVPQEEIFSFYSAADVFVYPSVSEPFGIAVLEALLSGTPVITSRSAGVLERLPRLGCVTTSGISSSELAEKIVSALRERRRVSESEKGAIKRAYSWEKSAAKMIGIYTRAIKAK